MNGIGGNRDKNVEGKEVPNARNWWEPGRSLPFYVPLDLLLQISQRRREGEDPQYWRRLRREQREAMRREEAEREAAQRAGDQGEGNKAPGEEEDDQMARQVEGVILEKDDDRVGDLVEVDVGSLNEETGEQIGDESQVIEAGEGIRTENALEETLETVEVTKKVMGGDAGTKEEEIQVGDLIFDQKELEGLLEDGEDEDKKENEVERDTFEGENKAVDQDKDKVDNQIMPRRHVKRPFVTFAKKKAKGLPILEEDKNESQTDHVSPVEDLEPPKKKNRKRRIIPDRDHVIVLPGNPPKYQCKVCQQSFKTKSQIDYHRFCEQPDTAKPFQCQDCKKGFVSKGHYKFHMRKHENLRPYKCNICSKAFFQQSELKRHLLTHTGERPFTCEECHRGFSSKQALKLHSSVHSGARAFSCPGCDKRFTRPGSLKRHAVVHTLERNFSCHFCDKRFARKDHLDMHLKIHTDQRATYECKKCSKSFYYKQDLKRHVAIHTGERAFKCTQCQRAFRRKDMFKRHVGRCQKRSKNAAKKMGEKAAQANSAGL